MIEPVEQLAPAPDEKYNIFFVTIYRNTNYVLCHFSRPLLDEEQLREIIEARNKTRIPQTLVALAIKAVAKHCTRFIDIPDCPLKYLRK
jgi:hypothetical protein